MKKYSFVLLSILLSALAKAQDSVSSPQMADEFRASGKIYIVITVIAMIFTAIVIFLAVIDRRLRKLEKQIKEN